MNGLQKRPGYIHRIVEDELQEALASFGAVEVRGAKWCGKTWTSLAFAEKLVQIDDERVGRIAATDSSAVLSSDSFPVVLDEWQDVPKVWDAVRRDIDAHPGSFGRFILTGSSTPAKDKVSHSGAGRIARVDMSTMTMLEKGEVSGGVSLSGLFEGAFKSCVVESPSLGEYASSIVKGGWPALVGRGERAASNAVHSYLAATFETSVAKKNGSPVLARRIASSLARNVGTGATLQTIADDVSQNEARAQTRHTVSRYIDLLEELYFLEELPGWDAPVRARSRVRTKPKRYFADPSIAAALLGAGSKRLMGDGQLLGILFEALCVHDIRVFARALPVAGTSALRYYSDADGLEVDVVIELPDGRWGGIEIKMNDAKVPDGTKNLVRLRKKVAANPMARNPAPEFMAVVTMNSPFAYHDEENDVYIMPFACLEP